jgi:hypothetical protein
MIYEGYAVTCLERWRTRELKRMIANQKEMKRLENA